MSKVLVMLPLPVAAVVCVIYLVVGDGPLPVVFRAGLRIIYGQSSESAAAAANSGNLLAAVLILLTPVVFFAAVVWGLIKR